MKMNNDQMDKKSSKSDLIELFEEGKKSEFEIDFVTTSAIKKMDLRFFLLYTPILWLTLFIIIAFWYNYMLFIPTTVLKILLVPIAILINFYVLSFGVAVFGKLFLIIINLLHKPKQGIFKIKKGNRDYEFWCLRIQLKKLVLWVMNNTPLPWVDTWGFNWFGVQVDLSSHMFDSWVDTEFIEIGRKVTVGQGAVVMSSMIVGKYLIIKKIIFDDHTVIGGVSNIAPGTEIGKETILGAFSTTHYDQKLEPGWVYFGNPAQKLKRNKYAEERTAIIYKKNVDDNRKYKVIKEINLDDGNTKENEGESVEE
jgi:carbonic anhydrase/acetyltransferase-like protein (isoleucine patch superfamily)